MARITRRKFIRAAGGLAAVASMKSSWGTGNNIAQQATASSQLGRIKSIIRRDEMIERSGGYGQVSGLTWTAEDRQLVAISEGMDWLGVAKEMYFQTALIGIDG